MPGIDFLTQIAPTVRTDPSDRISSGSGATTEGAAPFDWILAASLGQVGAEQTSARTNQDTPKPSADRAPPKESRKPFTPAGREQAATKDGSSKRSPATAPSDAPDTTPRPDKCQNTGPSNDSDEVHSDIPAAEEAGSEKSEQESAPTTPAIPPGLVQALIVATTPVEGTNSAEPSAAAQAAAPVDVVATPQTAPQAPESLVALLTEQPTLSTMSSTQQDKSQAPAEAAPTVAAIAEQPTEATGPVDELPQAPVATDAQASDTPIDPELLAALEALASQSSSQSEEKAQSAMTTDVSQSAAASEDTGATVVANLPSATTIVVPEASKPASESDASTSQTSINSVVVVPETPSAAAIVESSTKSPKQNLADSQEQSSGSESQRGTADDERATTSGITAGIPDSLGRHLAAVETPAAPRSQTDSSSDDVAVTDQTRSDTPLVAQPGPPRTQDAGTTTGHRSVPAAHAPQVLEHAAQGVHAAFTGGKEVQLKLSPPELGALQIGITVTDGQVSARLETSSPAVRQLLLDSLPKLQESLSQQGLQVDRLEVHLSESLTGNSGRFDGQAFSQQQQQQAEQEWLWENSGAANQRTSRSSAGPNAPHWNQAVPGRASGIDITV